MQDDSSARRRAVAFDKLEIYGFAKVLGDNPSAEGAPLRLDSRPDYRLLLHVDDYERRRSPRRHAEELRLSSLERETYLLATGLYRYDDVVDAAKENKKQQKQRWESFRRQSWEPYVLILENAKDVVGGFWQWVQEGPELARALFLFFLAYIIACFVF